MGRIVAIVVAVLAILLLYGFWPYYSQPWMAVVLDRIGFFVAAVVGGVIMVTFHFLLWFDDRF